MESNSNFLHSNENFLNLGYPEILMLRNYARKNNYKFCSMIGGSGSIRDIYQGINLKSDAFEFTLVESIFSIGRIFATIKNICLEEVDTLRHAKIFINISTPDGMSMVLDSINQIKPDFLNKSDIIFNFDITSLLYNYTNIKEITLDSLNYNNKIYSMTLQRINYLNNLNYLTSVSGLNSKESLFIIMNNDILPNYIRTELFSINILNGVEELYNNIRRFNEIELNLLTILKKSFYEKYRSIEMRELNLKTMISNK